MMGGFLCFFFFTFFAGMRGVCLTGNERDGGDVYLLVGMGKWRGYDRMGWEGGY